MKFCFFFLSRLSLGVESENGSLVASDEQTGGQLPGHDLQPAHVERVRGCAPPGHGKGPGTWNGTTSAKRTKSGPSLQLLKGL